MTDANTAGSAGLPLPDYDHLPTGSLQSRIRSLSADELRELLEYERAHADRLQVREIMQARLSELEDGAPPSSGAPDAARPEAAPPPHGGSRVSPQTSGPPINPPSQGVPSNPAQPR